MNEFLEIFKENLNNKSKAIIMAGGASVGKSTVIKAIKPMINDYKILNADDYVEDKTHPLHNNVIGAHAQIQKKDLPDAVNSKQNLVLDTTAGNIKTITPIINKLEDNNYDIIMIMVYAHPIISFIRNFKRERKVPAIGIISTWVNVYSLMDEYKRMFGDKFFLIISPASTEEEFDKTKEFQSAFDKGELKQYFMNLLDTGDYQSTFRKDDDEMSPEELEKKTKSREKQKLATENSIEKLASIYKDIESKLDPIEVGELPRKLDQLL